MKYVRSREGLRRLRTFIDNNDSDLEMWRARQSSVAQRDFFLLDRDDGAGWEYIKSARRPACPFEQGRRCGLPASWSTLGNAPCLFSRGFPCAVSAGLVAPRNERMSVAKALKDPFLKSPMTKRMAARNTRN